MLRYFLSCILLGAIDKKKQRDKIKDQEAVLYQSITRSAMKDEDLNREHALRTQATRNVKVKFINENDPYDVKTFDCVEQSCSVKQIRTERINGVEKTYAVVDVTKHKIFRGCLYYRTGSSGWSQTQKEAFLYLYFPKLTILSNGRQIEIGPLYAPDGSIDLTRAYAISIKGVKYYAQRPVREVISDMQCDFSNPACKEEVVKHYFSEKKQEQEYADRNLALGFLNRSSSIIMPVDFGNVEQNNQFMAYCMDKSPARRANELNYIFAEVKALSHQLAVEDEEKRSEEAVEEMRAQRAADNARRKQEDAERAAKEAQKKHDETEELLREHLKARKMGTFVSYNEKNMVKNNNYFNKK